VSDEELEQAVRRLRTEGYAPKEIARALGVRPAVVAPLVRMIAAERADTAAESELAECWVSPGWRAGLTVAGHPEWPGGETVDRETMRRTLHRVLREWKWTDTWGWDFPMVAMTAARLGEPDTAIDALFIDSPKNLWLPNGHNWQRANLPLYLPGNGGLLAATAMMACAWDGFPKRKWNVRWEGLRPLLAAG